MKKIVLIATFLTVCLITISQNYNLTVQIEDIKESKGEMYIGLFKNAETFPEKGNAAVGEILPAKPDSMHIIFRDVPAGKYAIAVYHDKNLDGKLTKNRLGIPKEYYGFSNNVTGSFGPPDFKKAAFDLNSDITITIKLK